MLDGPLTDSLEAIAFNKHYQINDIYSCRFAGIALRTVCERLFRVSIFVLPSL